MTAKQTVSASPPWKVHLAGVLVLAAVVCGVYGNSLVNGFVWDDQEIVVNNPVNRDLSGVGTLFRSADDLVTAAGLHTPYYRPLNRLTYLLDHQMFGLNPLGYHAENLLLHLAAVLCLYLLALRLFTEPVPALAAALLFAVHPVNAEAVNFISGRNNLLATLFVFLSLLTFLHAEGSRKWVCRWGSGVFFLMGLLCKETALMLLPFLFLHDISPLSSLRGRIREKLAALLPFVGSSAIYFALRAGALPGTASADLDMGRLGERLAQDLYIIPAYVGKLLLPVRLSINYDIPDIFTASQWWLVPAWLALTGALVCLAKGGRPATRFGLLWCAVNFLPVANIVPIPSAPMADRFMYLPAAGLWLVAADQFWALQEKARRAATVAGLLILVMLGSLTVMRNLDWRDDLSLFSSAVRVAPGSAWGHYGLGVVLMKRGDEAAAERELQRAVQIDPAYSDAYLQLAVMRLERNSLQEAEGYLAMAVRTNPGNAEALFNLALLLDKRGRPREALPYYEAFLGRLPARYESLLPQLTRRVEEIRRQ